MTKLKLFQRPIWVNWVLFTNEVQQLPRKVPINPKQIMDLKWNKAKSNKPNTWGTYQQAKANVGKKIPYRYFPKRGNWNKFDDYEVEIAGIGFMFEEGTFGIDIDINDDKPHLDEAQIQEILSMFPTYAERSPSGKGIHIVGDYNMKEIDFKKTYYFHNESNGVECYVGGMTYRFFTFTGNNINDYGVVNVEDESVTAFLEKYMKRPHKEKAQPQGHVARAKGEFDILSLARKAENSNKFMQLYDNGSWEGLYPSASEARSGLMCMLAFYEKDPTRLSELFKSSAMFDAEKWDREAEILLDYAIKNTNTYTPPKGSLISLPPKPTKFEHISLYELSQKDFAPETVIVDGLLQRGINLYVADPKLGKSIFGMNVCLHVAYNVPFWGRETAHGRVLYLALEDTERRHWRRLTKMRPAIKDYKDVPYHMTTAAATMNGGLQEQVDQFMTEYPDTLVIAMDILDKVLPLDLDVRGLNAYRAGMKEMRPFNDMSRKYPNVAFLIVHHSRKAEGASAIHKISGSQAYGGSVDNIVIFNKDKNDDKQCHVIVQARDMEDCRQPMNFTMRHNGEGYLMWEYVGETTKEATGVPKEDTRQGRIDEWVKGLFDNAEWILVDEFKRLAFVEGYINATQLQRSRSKNGIKHRKATKALPAYFYVDGCEPTAKDIDLWQQSKMEQSTLEAFIPIDEQDEDNPFLSS